MDFASLVITPSATVRETLQRIDQGGKRFALVVEGTSLRGVVSDGDVRRALLRGIDLDSSVTDVLNDHPATVHVSATQDEVDALKKQLGVQYIPVLDDDGALVDVVGPGERVGTPLTTPIVLMAGGRGTRLYPLTKDIPKPMVPVGGMPMIEVILRRIHAQGFRRIFVSVNYLGDAIEHHLGDGSGLGVDIEYIRETSPLGTAGSLAELQGRVDEALIVMNADLMTNVDLRRMVSFHRGFGYAATVGVREYTFEIPFGVVKLEGDTVVSLVEKPEQRELISAGIAVLDPRTLNHLVRDQYCDMPMLLESIIEAGETVGAFKIHEDWLDIGSPDDLARARQVANGGES